jgi:sugar phosphate isomerase/epimerase
MDTEKVGFMASLGFASMKPEEVLKTLSEIGYKAVGWTLAHLDPREKSFEEIKRVVALTKRYGMEVSEVVVQQDLVVLDKNMRKKTKDFVSQCIQTFSEAGITTINLITGPKSWESDAPRIGKDIAEGKAWDMVFEAFDAFVPQAEKFKMNLAVEGVFCMLCHDYYSTRNLIDHYDSSYLGVNFDPSHDILAGNLDVGWIVKSWSNKIKHVHLKDAVGIEVLGKFIFPLLGEGNVDWTSFFSALKEIGYSGYLSVEFESFKYYEQILGNDIKKAAVLSLDNIRKLTGKK